MLSNRMQRRAKPMVVGTPDSPFVLPHGKGIFIRSLSHAGTPDQLVVRAKMAGVTWVAVLVIWQHEDEDKTYNADLPDYALALRAAGISVWIWGYPERNIHRRQTFAAAMGVAALTSPASGIILDAEKPWLGASDADALSLVSMIRQQAPNRVVALTAYGHPASFPDFPWTGFAKTCDLGIPQAYFGHVELGPTYQADAVAAYQAMGFPAVVPALAAWGLTVAQMLEIYGRTPKPQDAVIWWDWYYANTHGTWPAIAAAGTRTPSPYR